LHLKNPATDTLWIDYKSQSQSFQGQGSRFGWLSVSRLFPHSDTQQHGKRYRQAKSRSGARLSLLKPGKAAVVGAVRIDADQPSRWRRLAKIAAAALILSGGAGILANTVGLQDTAPISHFKSTLLTSASLTPAIPTFRFDDADSIISNTVQTAMRASAVGRPSSQAFAPQAFASLVPDVDGMADLLTGIETNPTAVLLPPLAPRLSAQGLAPSSEQSAKQNYQKIHVVESGDSFYRVLEKNKFPGDELNTILQNDIVAQYLTKLRIGDKVEFDYYWNGDLDNISVKVSRDTRIQIVRDSLGSYQVAKTYLPLEYERVVTTGRIDESLYAAAEKANLKQSTIMALADIFEWELDFARDIRRGDSFSIVYDRLYRDSKYIGDGEILAAEFVRGDRPHRAIRFTDDEGRSDYYSPSGQSKRRSFMRHPVDIVRITSRFDPNRLHPVLQQIRAHKGVDYGAPHGSPVKATADGTVDFSGDKGAYGNTVILQHGDDRSTLYAHMSRIAKKARKGARVKRGDIIGYVGKTGRVTGSHLHYEFRIAGEHVDPLKVELPVAAALDKKYLSRLKAESQELIAQMSSVRPYNRVASAE